MANIYNIGISALVTAQQQLSTTGHNIANVNTEGYSRQRVEQTQFPPQSLSNGYLGSGVHVSEISRVVDQFLIEQLETANANEARATALADLSSGLETLLGDGTVTNTLEAFFAALNDANGDPGSIATREVLLNTAATFAARLSDVDQQLDRIARDVNAGVEAIVADVNALSASIADLNERIVSTLGSATGAPPNDLLDQRDRLINELSMLTGVSTLEQENGALNVFIGNGQAVVTNFISIPLTTVPDPLDGTRLEVATTSGGNISVISQSLSGGELGATLEFRDDVLAAAQNSVGRLAAVLAVTLNEQNREGFTLNDTFGADLFTIGAPQVNSDPANSGAISVALDTANISALTIADYDLSHDGTSFTLTNLSDQTTQTLAGAGPFYVDGLIITVTAPPVAGDTYRVLPTRAIARDMDVAILDPNDLALALPVRSSASLNNIGDATIADPVVLDVSDPALLNAVQLVFNDPPTTYQLNGVGPLLPYTSGADMDINGWRVQISGSPEPGDTFDIDANVGAAGDNGNGLDLAALQLAKLVDDGSLTYLESYGQLVARVGSSSAQAEVTRDAMTALRENAEASRDSLSAVNLDEEAAQLLRFEQAYTAAAQVIAIANEIFSTLLQAVRR